MDIIGYVIKYAQSWLKESEIIDGGSRQTLIPISFCFYLLITPGRYILVDAGCDGLSAFEFSQFVRPDIALGAVGVKPEQITDIVITHHHRDHMQGILHYKNAVSYMTKETYQQGKDFIPQGMRVKTFENIYILQEGIRVVQNGGHCPGSAFVEIQTGDKTHILAGDECYTNQNIEKQLVSGAYFDKAQAKRFVETYSGNTYVVHTCHDITLKTERIL